MRTLPLAPASRTVRAAALLVLGLALPATSPAQHRRLTLDDIYDPEKKLELGGTPATGLAWISDTHFLWPKSDPKTKATQLLRVEAATGKAEPFLSSQRMEQALARLPGVSREEAGELARRTSYTMNERRSALLLTLAGDLYQYEPASDRALRLTWEAGEEELASYSPDGRLVAFVRGSDLHVVDVASQRERALTSDGGENLLNGKLDWVYQEEVYGRGNFKGYWWSPDSTRIAFLQLDETGVPRYTLVDDRTPRPVVETWPYPKAGDPNPKARLGVVRAAGGRPLFVDLDRYAAAQPLIVDVVWAPDSRRVVFQVQDREQRWLELCAAEAASGAPRTLLRETSPAWVIRIGSPKFLKDGSFLWLSERSGWQHVYHYRPDGELVRQVTDGRWEADALHGIDAAGWIYFSGTERSAIGKDVYRIRLDGSGLARLSATPGTHAATFNPSLTQYLDSWSDVATPPQTRLHRADGHELRVVEANPVPLLAELRLSKPEFLQVETRDGFPMEAMLIRPPAFEPTRKYPVFQQTYGGPHAPRVKNAWNGNDHLFLQLLAQEGIVVWVCDNRSASGKGQESVWPVWKRLGELELQDIEDGVGWLKRQAWVDGEKIGLYGWSYGGFVTAYALTHSRSFAMGIAGAPVTDWRLYDSIYTERMMLTPQNNPEGYRASSPRLKAAELHGELLLLHGAIDDNVHPQNSLQFAYELQRAGKPFRMMLYPGARHAVGEPALLKHLRATMLDFIRETLLAAK
jgi:dipeptidyl-peptidase-4